MTFKSHYRFLLVLNHHQDFAKLAKYQYLILKNILVTPILNVLWNKVLQKESQYKVFQIIVECINVKVSDQVILVQYVQWYDIYFLNLCLKKL